jgi:hypothetical protein
MNSSDQIIGNCFHNGGAAGFQFDGFLLSGGVFTPIDFTNSDVNNTLLSRINDSGEIVGSYSDVPEPGTLTLLATGFLALLGTFKRKLSAASQLPA